MKFIYAILKIVLKDQDRSATLHKLRRKITRKHTIWA